MCCFVTRRLSKLCVLIVVHNHTQNINGRQSLQSCKGYLCCCCCCTIFNKSHVLHLKSETVVVRTRMNMAWMIYDGHMIFVDESGLNFLTFVWKLRETRGKNLNQEIDPIGNRTRAIWIAKLGVPISKRGAVRWKIFGAKRDKITWKRRKLYNTELNALYSSLDTIRNLKSRRLRWAGHVARME